MAAELSAALSRLIAAGAARAALLGGLLIPTNRMHIESGEAPGSKHVHYHYDEGFLTLSRLGPTGETEILFHGHHGPDGSFINADGDALARDMGRGIFIDGNAVRALDLRTTTRGHARQIANENDHRAATNDNIKFCPDVGPDAKSNDKLTWRLYQRQITGLAFGLAVKLNGVRFDGCDETRRVMLEAKGEDYEWAIEGEDFFPRYKGRAGIVVQMMNQSGAAGSRTVEWHIAESRTADVLRKIRDELGLESIVVIHTPADRRIPVLLK
ncbi:MAG: hypothetical protein JNM30_04560 [Rhodospirillales bacterium]|nr:hypothetical protein [Rhodospirillales bacterium]